MNQSYENSSIVQPRGMERVQVLRIPYNLTSDSQNSSLNDDLRQGYSSEEPIVTDTWETIEAASEGEAEILNDSDDFSEFVSLFAFYPQQHDAPTDFNHKQRVSKFSWERFTRSTMGRSQSAPARPLTELEELKESMEYECLELIVIMIRTLTDRNGIKLDLNSFNGHNLCNQLLSNIAQLAKLLNITPTTRKYRIQFATTYSSLYSDIEDFSYLVEVLDAAQERFSCIIINGEKYVFSSNLLRYAEELLNSFARVRNYIERSYEEMCEGIGVGICERFKELKALLIEFDKCWARFERLYIFEHMIIENDAKRFIVKAVKIEKKLRAFELSEKLKGNLIIRSPRYLLLRKKFLEVCGKINSIANYIGTGRDNLDSEIIVAAEETLRQISDNKSLTVRKLAIKIKATFDSLRFIFQQYSNNLESVDPELSNNQELVDALVAFEKAWERGRFYLLNPPTRQMLVNFTQLIEGLSEKYENVKEMFETMEADVFLIVPSLAILRSLEKSNKIMYSLYCPDIENKEGEEFKQLKNMYKAMKRREGSHQAYNKLEQAILELNHTSNKDVEKMVHKIKRLAIILQRNKPSDWNLLMETAMGII